MGFISDLFLFIAIVVVVSALLSSFEKSREWSEYAEANGCVEVDRRQELINSVMFNGNMAVPHVIAVTKIKYKCRNGAEVWR